MKWSLWIIIPSLRVLYSIPKIKLLILHGGHASQDTLKTSDISLL